MKKTSYILFATIVVFAVAAFLGPLVVCKTKKVEEILLVKNGKEMNCSVDRFNELYLDMNMWHNCYVDNPEGRLRVEVVEKDSVFRPTVVMDSSWVGNCSLGLEGGVLELSVNMDRILKDAGGDSRVKVDGDNALLARIYVPEGMLTTISPTHFDLTLRDFKNSNLKLVGMWNGVAAFGCSFNELVMDND